MLARSFLHDAKVVLIDEPTQGVDAKARFDIYRAIRAKADAGRRLHRQFLRRDWSSPGSATASLVFSRGRIVRELVGASISEEKIVSSFLSARDVAAKAKAKPKLPSKPERPRPCRQLRQALSSREA